MRLGVLATHPIQYHAPLYRALARELDLTVYFAHRQTAEGQAKAGFGVAFEWDVPLLDGYEHRFLENRASEPDVSTFRGCDTPEISRIIAGERFDAFLVNGWYTKSFWQAIKACWRTGTPLMVRGDSHLGTPRKTWFRVAKEGIYRLFIPRFDAYLVVGERAREYYLHYGADPERMFFVPHFVDNDWFAERAAAEDPAGLRRELGLDEDALVVLFVGKFMPEKRPGDVIRAASRVQTKGGGVQVVMVGAGDLEPALRAEAEGLGAPVHFAGFKNQSELPRYYAGADVLVLPSVTETWGLVVNEAMACGTPVVVSDAVGCAPDLVDEGATGFTFPVGDTEALAGALDRVQAGLRGPATRAALAEKMDVYSLDTAVRGVLEAVRAVSA